MLDNRYSRAARALAAKLETESSIRINVSTPAADSYIFRVMQYLCHYFGKYWIQYNNDGFAIIRKQG